MMMQIKGLAADGGKDSSSMAVKYLGRLIPSPAELVIEGTAPVPDVTRRVTPDLKARGDSSLFLIDIGAGKDRLGGSSLAYALGQLGDESPDIDDVQRLIAAYECVQWLLDEGKILSLHDRSDGGLLATLAEMSLAGNVGIEYILGASTWLGGIKRLFNQEAGWVLEAQTSHELDIVSLFNQFKVPCRKIGSTSPDRQFIVRSTSELGMNIHLAELREMYEATSDKLEAMQVNPAVVEKRRKTYIPVHESPDPVYTATFTPERNFPAIGQAYNPSVCILREEGTNGDDEMRAAFFEAGFNPYDVCMQDLVSGKTGLDGFQGIVFCGGFSYMDVLDSAKGWAATILHDPRLRAMFERFYIRSDTFSLGVCNGFQLMTQLGWLPTPKAESDQPRLVHNDSGVFESGWTSVRIAKSPSILFKGMEGSVLPVWYAHGEGKLVIPKRQYESVKRNNLIPLYYADLDGAPTMEYPYCPNGSLDGIAALCSPDGRHTGMMPHPERCFRLQTWQWTSKSLLDQVGGVSPWLTFFQNARPWCLSHRR
jgi:phosphoribosylformylglycinamidine synthase